MLDTFALEPQTFIESFGTQVVLADRQFDSTQASLPSEGNRGLHEARAQPVTTMRRQ